MLVKISKEGFLRRSFNAGMNILKGKNIERAQANKDRLVKTFVESKTLNKDTKTANKFHDLMSRHDNAISKEKLRTRVTRGGMFAGIVGGTMHGMGDSMNNDAAQAQPIDIQYKHAAVEFENIPKDTSKPTTQSPTDGMDYYDYQEWVAAETGNAPDRSNLPVLGEDEKNAPLKIAHELGCDLFVVNAIEEYLGMREVTKEAGIPTEEVLEGAQELKETTKKTLGDRLKSSINNINLHRKGSKLLGAAMIAGAGYGAARVATNLYNKRPDFRHDWYN